MATNATTHTPGPWHAITSIGEPHWVLAVPPGDEEGVTVAEVYPSDADTRLIAAAPEMAAALYFLGGGSVWLEMHGRLCFCPRQGKGDDSKHAKSCVDAFKAWQKAGSPIGDR